MTGATKVAAPNNDNLFNLMAVLDAVRDTLIVIRKHLRAAVIPTVPDLALGETQADRQTFQVFKTWKV